MYKWIITLVNGERYVVANDCSNFIDFSKHLYGTEKETKRVISINELETPIFKDVEGGIIKISKVAIDSDKIVSVEW